MASQTAEAVPDKKKKPSALRSILAGSTAGAIEIGMARDKLQLRELNLHLEQELTFE